MKRQDKPGRKNSRSTAGESTSTPREKTAGSRDFKERDASAGPRKRTTKSDGFSDSKSSGRSPASFDRKDRAAGRSFDKDSRPPRRDGDADRGERKPFGSRESSPKKTYDKPTRNSRPTEGGSDRPSRAPREDRPTRPSSERDFRPSRGASSDERPRKSYDKDDRPARAEGSGRVPYNREERPKKSFGSDERPTRERNTDRPSRSNSDRASRGSDERPSRPTTSRSSDDRPRKTYDKDDRSSRPSSNRGTDDRSAGADRGSRVPYNREERPKKSFGRDERSSRPTGDREARPSRETASDDRPKKSFGRDEKPSRTFDKKQSDDFNEFDDDKPTRSFDKSEDRPKRAYDKSAKKSGRKTPDYFGEPSSDGGPIRLNRFVSMAGICSRREADVMIEAGLFSVNGIVVTELGAKVNPTDDIRYNGERIRNERNVYLLLNKPKDYITTMDDPEQRHTVMELVANACKERIYPVGRLDRNTTGLLLFTNDGDLAKTLTHPSSHIRKIYHAELDKGLKVSDMKKLVEGVEIDEIGFIQVDDIAYDGDGSDKKQVGLEIHSGQNRVVRRMFEHLGYDVRKLDRVVFAGLTKKDLGRGRWRMLTENEVAMLKMVTKKDVKKK